MPELVEAYTTEEAFHARRRLCVGASEVAALFGCHEYMTANRLYHLKRGTGIDDHRRDVALRNFGHVMEPIIGQLVADKTGWKLDNLTIQEHHLLPSDPRIGCTVDRFIVESERGPGILQIKNVSSFSPGWSETRAPDMYEYQVLTELMVEQEQRGIRWGCIGALFGGDPDNLRVMVRYPDPKVEKAIRQRVARFWDMVLSGREPPIVSDDFEHVADMFKAAETREEEVRRLGVDWQEVAVNFVNARAARLAAEKVENEAKAKLLRAAMIEKVEGMERDLAVVCPDLTVEFKITDVAARAVNVGAYRQLNINVKENQKEING